MRNLATIASALILVACACREREPAPAFTPDDPLTPMRIAADAEMGFVYADLSGKFRTAGRVSGVPRASRAVVRVIDPTAKAGQRGDYDLVHIVDLTGAAGAGGFETRLVARSDFERHAIARLPPGVASRVQIPGADSATGELASHGQIIVYSTSWCGACKQLRDFLRSRQVEFVERDVEREVGAAAELAGKSAAAGIAADRVPIIDVRGRILVGFDSVRLTTLLGDQI